MKTMRIFIAAAIAALTVYSCSSDREDEILSNENQKTELKLNKKEFSRGGTEDKIEQDTIIGGPKSSSQAPNLSIDPDDNSEIVHPGGVKPPKP